MKRRALALCLLVALVAPIMLLIQANTVIPNTKAQITKLSVPEFTVSQVDRSYDVPVTTTYSTDPFTGQQVTHSSGGNHVQNRTIDVTIKNQPFTSTDLGNGSVIQLYYSVRTKGHFGDWSEVSSTNGYTFKRVLASNLTNTVITLILSDDVYKIQMGEANLAVPEGGQEDFQVKAEAGYLYPDYGGHAFLPRPLSWDFVSFGESSWSNTQTLTFPTSNPSPPSPPSSTSPSPTPTPDQTTEPTPEESPQTLQLEAIIGTVIAVAVVAAGLLVYFRKHKRQPPAASSTNPHVETAE